MKDLLNTVHADSWMTLPDVVQAGEICGENPDLDLDLDVDLNSREQAAGSAMQ
jgi:hypothetical protein